MHRRINSASQIQKKILIASTFYSANANFLASLMRAFEYFYVLINLLPFKVSARAKRGINALALIDRVNR